MKGDSVSEHLHDMETELGEALKDLMGSKFIDSKN